MGSKSRRQYGATADQAAALQAGTQCATVKTDKGWSCEWRVTWEAPGVSPKDPPQTWHLNVGVYAARSGTWLAWAPTGVKMCEVSNAGDLRLLK